MYNMYTQTIEYGQNQTVHCILYWRFHVQPTRPFVVFEYFEVVKMSMVIVGIEQDRRKVYRNLIWTSIM